MPSLFTPPQPLSEGHYRLISDNGEQRACQRLADGQFAFLETSLPANTARTYTLELTAPSEPPAVEALSESAGSLAFHARGDLLTRYYYENVPARPYSIRFSRRAV